MRANIPSWDGTSHIAKFGSYEENLYGNKNEYNHHLLKFVEIIPFHNHIYKIWTYFTSGCGTGM